MCCCMINVQFRSMRIFGNGLYGFATIASWSRTIRVMFGTLSDWRYIIELIVDQWLIGRSQSAILWLHRSIMLLTQLPWSNRHFYRRPFLYAACAACHSPDGIVIPLIGESSEQQSFKIDSMKTIIRHLLSTLANWCASNLNYLILAHTNCAGSLWCTVSPNKHLSPRTKRRPCCGTICNFAQVPSACVDCTSQYYPKRPRWYSTKPIRQSGEWISCRWRWSCPYKTTDRCQRHPSTASPGYRQHSDSNSTDIR